MKSNQEVWIQWSPVFECSVDPDGQKTYRVGRGLIDEFLEFASARCRPSTVRAYAHDLKVFFGVVDKDPSEVTPKDVLSFIASQQRSRAGVSNVVRISDGGSGLSVATVKRRLAAVSSLFSYLVIRGDAGVTANPVPRGMPTRRSRHRDQRGVPLVKGVRRLPRILDADEVEQLMSAFRTDRDGPWLRPCCSVVCDGARCWVSGSRTSRSVRSSCSSPTARVATTVGAFADVLLDSGRLHEQGATTRRCDGPRIRCPQRSETGTRPVFGRTWTRCSAPPGPEPDWCVEPAMSSATPASPD